MNTKNQYKLKVSKSLQLIQDKINEVLNGNNFKEIEPILKRIDASGNLPEWFIMLKDGKKVPTKDGKTIGSILEKLLVCIIERYILNDFNVALSVNPAKGVDIPELDLGVKSPSTNFCTSEPYFSAYERLLGNEYDAIVLLTNFQNTKGGSKLDLQILQICYLRGSEIADMGLCNYAKQLREIYNSDHLSLKRLIRFLAYVNQSDWEAKKIIDLIDGVVIKKRNVNDVISEIEKDYYVYNKKKIKENKVPIDISTLDRLRSCIKISPVDQGVIKIAEDWVIENQSDNGRYPNENEWRRFLSSPLDGKITMSFALQWRYNFGGVFKIEKDFHKTSLSEITK